jgi:hypothetical protein
MIENPKGRPLRAWQVRRRTAVGLQNLRLRGVRCHVAQKSQYQSAGGFGSTLIMLAAFRSAYCNLR